jgi:glucose-fructose oxidoreductase
MNPKNFTRRRFLSTISTASALAMHPQHVLAEKPAGKKLGIALVGLGRYSTGQLGPALKLTQDCRLAAVVTSSPEKGKKWAADYGFPESHIYNYDTIAQMADNPDIDIVYVVTPNSLHAPHTIAAAKAGKHVICEKPMATSVKDCDAMIAACKNAKVQLAIGYRSHYEPCAIELKRLAKTAEIGTFTKMDGGFSFVMKKPEWRIQKTLAGGGPLMDLGIYVIQSHFMAAGDVMPIAITARELPKQRPDFFTDVEETIEWEMEFPNGSRGTARTSYNQGRNEFRAESATGWYHITSAYGYQGHQAKSHLGPFSFTSLPSIQAAQMDAFARHVRDGAPNQTPGEMGRRDLVVVEAIYASAAAGKPVKLAF